mgnify:CR=1 FL=1
MSLLALLLATFTVAHAQTNDNDVFQLPKTRTVFTLVRNITLPTDRNAELWIQQGHVGNGERLHRNIPACTLRHYGRGTTLTRGTAYPMPDSVIRGGPLSFRAIPIERRTGMVLDCASQVDYGRFGPYLAGDLNRLGRLTVGQLRQALQGVFTVTILPRR